MGLTRRSFLSATAAAAVHGLTQSAWAQKKHEQAGFTFVQMCDTQLGMGGYEHDVETFRLAVRQINAMKPQPAFVCICGDLVNTPGSEKEIREFNAIKAGFKVDCYCVPGNHDVGNEAKPELLKLYREAIGEDYFCKELSDCMLVGLNTQLWKSPLEGESEKQDNWLAGCMEKVSTAGKPILVCGHHPLFLENAREEEKYYNLPPENRQRLLRLFRKHSVAAYLSGHTHRNLINEYEGIQLVTSATTSRNFDGAPMGFRLWHVRPPRPYKNEYVAIEGAKPPADKK